MLSSKILEKAIANNYFILLFLAYAMNFFVDFRPAVFMIIVNILLLFFSIIKMRSRVKGNPVLLFCLYLCVSLVFSCITNSISQAISSFLYIFTPCALFFATDNEDIDVDYILMSFVFASFANELLGTICFYTKPGFFVDFVYRTNKPAYEQLTHFAGAGRLITMFGSIETAQFASLTMIVCTGFISNNSKYKKLCILPLIFSGIVLILTQQRGPLFAYVIGVIFVIVRFRAHVIKPRVLILFGIVAAVGMTILYLYVPIVFGWMVDRISNPYAAIEGRYDYQWDVLVNNLNPIEWFFGSGIGSYGFFVEVSTRLTRIFDQMYFNIIGEEGIIGLILFLCILFSCFQKFVKNPNMFLIPSFIVFEIAFSGIGTTLIYYPPIMPLFWFSVGIIFHNQKIHYESSSKLRAIQV